VREKYYWLDAANRVLVFFHAAGSGCRRRNNIAVLESDVASAHGPKSAILHNFYFDLLDRARDTNWRFRLQDLYPALDLASWDFSSPFTASEITEALFFSMACTQVPAQMVLGLLSTNFFGRFS